jgi:hypothetical protein
MGCAAFTRVVIPKKVTHLCAATFFNCSGLESVTIRCRIPPIIDWSELYNDDGGLIGHAFLVFNNTNDCPIRVPAGFVQDYCRAEGWNVYADRIVEIDG